MAQRSPVALNRPPWDWVNRIFKYVPREVPGPGTGNYAALPAFSLPGQSVSGPGVVWGNGVGYPNVLPGQQMVYHQAQVVNGVNGVVFGGINPQGLVDMEKLVKAQAA